MGFKIFFNKDVVKVGALIEELSKVGDTVYKNGEILIWLDEGKKTDRISFLRKDYQYRKNLTRIFNAEMGANVPENKNDTRYLDGLEPDFKQ